MMTDDAIKIMRARYYNDPKRARELEREIKRVKFVQAWATLGDAIIECRKQIVIATVNALSRAVRFALRCARKKRRRA